VTQQSFLIELAPKLGQAVHDIEIRQLNVDDVGVFRAIRLEALRLEPSAYASDPEDWASLSDEQWRDRLQVPIFVAFRGGEPVGIMGLLRQQPSKMKQRSTLIMVYLRASERGKGLARGLLEAVVEFAAQNGIFQIELNVSSQNDRAICFYERSDFRKIGLLPAGMIVSAMALPYAARLDGCAKRHGISSSMRLFGCPSRMSRSVAAT
jgi:RimJ/RimL family protein N-acetyltransferase